MKEFYKFISTEIERVSNERFEKWSKFLGRKMLFGLVAMMLLVGSFILAIGLALAFGSVDLMKALGSDLWTGLCTSIVALFGTATAGNVMEHKEKTKQQLSTTNP